MDQGNGHSDETSAPADWDVHAGAYATLGGYFREHDRPPAFEGPDGEPYTVSPEVEKTPNLLAPYEGYLVFPRWATTGLGVVGHVETETLCTGRGRQEVLDDLGELPLLKVKALLDAAVARARSSSGSSDDTAEG